MSVEIGAYEKINRVKEKGMFKKESFIISPIEKPLPMLLLMSIHPTSGNPDITNKVITIKRFLTTFSFLRVLLIKSLLAHMVFQLLIGCEKSKFQFLNKSR